MANDMPQRCARLRRMMMAAAACAAAMGCCHAVLAQAAGAALACRADSYAAHAADAQAPSWPRQAPAQALDAACWVTPAQLARSESAAAPPVLIDVRPRVARQSAPIANALEVELSELPHKRFLRQEPLVLVGTGLDYADLAAACRRLQAQGFASVRALRGGAAAWREASASGSPRLRPISASEWMASLGQGIRWTVLPLGDAVLRAPADRIPVPGGQVVAIPGAGAHGMAAQDADRLASAVVRAYRGALTARQASPVPEAAIVVAGPAIDGTLRLRIEQAIAAMDAASTGVPIYWLQGGWQAYEHQAAQAAAIQQTAGHGLQAPCGRM